MEMQAELPFVYPDLSKHEKRVFEAIDMFCKQAWQNSSKDIRRKYRRFALTPAEFRKEEREHEDRIASGQAVRLFNLIHHVLEPLVSITDDYDPSWMNIRESGRTLRFASYAGCVLGGVASPGDLELEMDILEKSREWPENSWRPHEMLEYRRNGDNFIVPYFLNGRLKQASAQIAALVLKNASRNCINNAPSPWFSEKEGSYEMDPYILNTQYHLIVSLLRIVEPEPGHA